MANPQPNEFTTLSNELLEAIIQTGFTKRQRSILDLIFRLSYGIQRCKYCLIPKQADFSLCGVTPNHLKKEIENLISKNVIGRDGTKYWIKKDYDLWDVPKHFDNDKMNALIHYNLDSQNGNSQKRKKTLPKTGTTLFPKEEVVEHLMVDNHSGIEPPKESTKESKEIEPTPAKADDKIDAKAAKRAELEEGVDDFIEMWNELSPVPENYKSVKLRGMVKGGISRVGDDLWDAAVDYWFCVNSPDHNNYEPRTLSAWFAKEFYRKFLPGFNPRIAYRKKT